LAKFLDDRELFLGLILKANRADALFRLSDCLRNTFDAWANEEDSHENVSQEEGPGHIASQ
jgi:hypothetical protein